MTGSIRNLGYDRSAANFHRHPNNHELKTAGFTNLRLRGLVNPKIRRLPIPRPQDEHALHGGHDAEPVHGSFVPVRQHAGQSYAVAVGREAPAPEPGLGVLAVSHVGDLQQNRAA